MKQIKLIKKLYKACLSHNVGKQQELYKKEFAKIFKHRNLGKHFTPKWTVIR